MFQQVTGISMSLTIILGLSVSAFADTMIGVSYSNPSPSHGMTFLIDSTTGTGQNLGMSNINFLNSLARDNGGTFWSTGMPNGDLRNYLIKISPTTGTGTLGPLLSAKDQTLYIDALAVSPSNVLYGMDMNDYLYRINTNSGAGTLVGRVGVPGYPIGINALAFAPDGTLYGWGVERNGLIVINPDTAAYTDVNPSVGGGGFIQALTCAADGTLYGARDNLYTIDRTTGIATQVGTGAGFEDVRGIAFLSVPESSSIALLGVGVIGVLGWRWRGRCKRG